MRGFEPPSLAAQRSERCVFTNFTTSASDLIYQIFYYFPCGIILVLIINIKFMFEGLFEGKEEGREGRKNDGGNFMAIPPQAPGEILKAEAKMLEEKRRQSESKPE